MIVFIPLLSNDVPAPFARPFWHHTSSGFSSFASSHFSRPDDLQAPFSIDPFDDHLDRRCAFFAIKMSYVK
jgi:hypothetical protein